MTARLQSPATCRPMDPSGVKVLLLENIHSDATDYLVDRGFSVQTHDGALEGADLIEAIRGVHLLGIRSGTQVTAEVLEAASDLLAIGAFCIGTNQIDLGAAASNGVAVFNAPYSNTRSVVELAIAEIIALARRLHEKSTDMHAGVWNKSATGSHEIRGRRVGIVGYGNIGSQLSVLVEALGMSVSFYDTADKLALGNARKCGSLDELLAESDVVTLHVDGRPGNAGLFGAEQFAKMKPRALFLNLSRGIAVDTAALRSAIESGHVAGAAVDVFPVEPKRQGDPFESDLRGLPNVILTPHVGGSTLEAQQHIGQYVAVKLTSYLVDGMTDLSPNMPNLNLPRTPATHRVAFLHQNVPGVLSKFNGCLAQHGVNVEAQALGTREHLGYLLTDIATDMTDDELTTLTAMDENVRLRLLPEHSAG